VNRKYLVLRVAAVGLVAVIAAAAMLLFAKFAATYYVDLTDDASKNSTAQIAPAESAASILGSSPKRKVGQGRGMEYRLVAVNEPLLSEYHPKEVSRVFFGISRVGSRKYEQ